MKSFLFVLIATSTVVLGILWFIHDTRTQAILGWSFLTASFMMLAYGVVCGIDAYRQGRDFGRSGNTYLNHAETHVWHIDIFSVIALTGLALIVFAVRTEGSPTSSMELYYVHMGFVLATVYFFLFARVIHPGIKSPKNHRKFVYWFILFYLITFLTGSVLLNNRFQIVG